MVASCKRQGGLDGRGEKPRAGWKRRIRRFPAAKVFAEGRKTWSSLIIRRVLSLAVAGHGPQQWRFCPRRLPLLNLQGGVADGNGNERGVFALFFKLPRFL
ncbi:hypothetical protein HPP92_015714 [Vanilla planifolia]|uniref:Uncharacterized protein n=1 Tax=Vanilla planifolia TaxID=51239 RepID=A0A835UTY0_VANPL|nr:hypothetical protein HPP92_015714 [Vanilla planifolia]